MLWQESFSVIYFIFEPVHEISNIAAYAQSDQSLCQSLEYSMIVKLLIEHHLEFLSLTGGCRGLSESTHVKMSNCWKSRAVAHLFSLFHIVSYIF